MQRRRVKTMNRATNQENCIRAVAKCSTSPIQPSPDQIHQLEARPANSLYLFPSPIPCPSPPPFPHQAVVVTGSSSSAGRRFSHWLVLRWWAWAERKLSSAEAWLLWYGCPRAPGTPEEGLSMNTFGNLASRQAGWTGDWLVLCLASQVASSLSLTILQTLKKRLEDKSME